MDRKILLIILDGAGDRPLEDGLTPLQKARTPEMNTLATEGICGLMDVISPGIPPGSDTGHIAILGYDPYKLYTGRGAFEAAGVGIKVKQGDIAFRCNFATIENNIIIDRRAQRIKHGTKELAKSINGMNIDGVEVIFREGTEHRAVLVLRGNGLSTEVSDGDPHRTGTIIPEVVPLKPEARFTADVLNKVILESKRILSEHAVNRERVKSGLLPANIILHRGAGIVPEIEPFSSKYCMKAKGVAGVGLLKGVFSLFGIEIVDVPGATGGTDTNLKAKSEYTVKALKEADIVFLNVKAPDVYGHDGDGIGKIAMMEKLDDMVGYIRNNVHGDSIISLTSDHSTPVSVREHTGDPVPLLIWGSGLRRDWVNKFDEISAARGGLGRIRGIDLMPILMDCAGKSVMYGA